ncbi:hypothetical protein FQK07_02120 [Synechococcus sp. BSF8S]|uniref:hypothetical protein n=1 Tax=unclassified Synechococcus TaxID=2626047 RepID=UPI0016252BDE|nr:MULTISPECIES: hypothetical protein [unclassified Synechococcus]MBC1260075.1 hypothetical protein [Synechococcus sp. BSF8S]MBC1263108.1 hypothetical protein [Synechococcus sp. BSA11S]
MRPQALLLLGLALIQPLIESGVALAEEGTTEAIPGSADEGPTSTEEKQMAEPPPSPWSATAEIYGFFPLRTTGSTTVKGLTADLDLDLEQVLRPLTMAAYVRGSVEYKRLGLLTDLSYVSLRGEEATTSPSGVRKVSATLNNIQGIYDLALRYRFGDREQAIAKGGSFNVIPYAGVRFVDMRYELSAQFDGPNRSLSGSRSFGGTVTQPLLGTQASVFLSPRLRLFARGDVGGFGVNNSDDYSANAQVGVGYAVGNNTQLNLSWRYLHLGGTNDQSPENAYSIDHNGVEMGVKFFF